MNGMLEIVFCVFILVPNVSILPAKKLPHLTLTHGLASLFNLSNERRSSLLQLARICIDLDRSVNWTLRLYSREQSSVNEVRFFLFFFVREQKMKEYLFFFLF